MLYSEVIIKKHTNVNAVLDYHLRRKLKKTITKNSLYNKSKTND